MATMPQIHYMGILVQKAGVPPTDIARRVSSLTGESVSAHTPGQALALLSKLSRSDASSIIDQLKSEEGEKKSNRKKEVLPTENFNQCAPG